MSRGYRQRGRNEKEGFGKLRTLKPIVSIESMGETVAIPRELLVKIMRKMESVEEQIDKLDRLAKIKA